MKWKATLVYETRMMPALVGDSVRIVMPTPHRLANRETVSSSAGKIAKAARRTVRLRWSW